MKSKCHKFFSWAKIHKSSKIYILYICESESHSVVADSLRPHGLYNPWNSPGQNTGVGSLSLLQGIFLTQESNQGLLHCRWILYQLGYWGSPILFIYIYVYKRFSTMLVKGLRKNITKKKREGGETGKHKLNEMGALNVK